MDLTKKEALKLHRQMWVDMQNELGDNPREPKRFEFKRNWIKTHGYFNYKEGVSNIMDSCFLCEFAIGKRRKNISFSKIRCEYCPIDWSDLTNPSSDLHGFCIDTDDNGYEVWQVAPISKILALPERKD